MQIRHIGIVIPAHNEQAEIANCLTAIEKAITKLTAYSANFPNKIQTSVVVVLDSCTDNTQKIVTEMATHAKNKGNDLTYLTCDYQCVGKVRDFGIRQLIQQGADWIACTDADSQVSENWLVTQIQHIGEAIFPAKCDMICGVVSIDNWAHLAPSTKRVYLEHYQDNMGHHHIHGANLSFSADGYNKVGGFADLACHEDVDLVKKFEQFGLTIIWSNKVRVTTSSRLDARANEGFAGFLQKLENENREV